MGQRAAKIVADSKSPGERDSILKVSGTRIVDGEGKEVILKGVSFEFNVLEMSCVFNIHLGWFGRAHEHGKLHYRFQRT